MIMESAAILVIIALILFIFIRERRFEYARTSGILMILPGAYLVSYFISFACNHLFEVNRQNIVLVGTVIGMLAACLLIGLMAYHIKKQRLRAAYVLINGLFVLILGTIMIFDTMQRVF